MKSKSKRWYTILEAARVCALKDLKDPKKGLKPFTARELAAQAHIKVGTPKPEAKKELTPELVASAWLGKMVNWGYVARAGSRAGEGGRRWVRLYEITKWGLKYRPQFKVKKVAANKAKKEK